VQLASCLGSIVLLTHQAYGTRKPPGQSAKHHSAHGSLGSGYGEAVQLGAETLTTRFNFNFKEQAQLGTSTS